MPIQEYKAKQASVHFQRNLWRYSLFISNVHEGPKQTSAITRNTVMLGTRQIFFYYFCNWIFKNRRLELKQLGKKVNACTFLADLAKLLSTQLCTASSKVCLSSSQGQALSRNGPETPKWPWESTHKTHNWTESLFWCLTLLPRTMLLTSSTPDRTN